MIRTPNLEAHKIAKTAVFEPQEVIKLISRKSWVTEKSWNFYTVPLSRPSIPALCPHLYPCPSLPGWSKLEAAVLTLQSQHLLLWVPSTHALGSRCWRQRPRAWTRSRWAVAWFWCESASGGHSPRLRGHRPRPHLSSRELWHSLHDCVERQSLRVWRLPRPPLMWRLLVRGFWLRLRLEVVTFWWLPF